MAKLFPVSERISLPNAAVRDQIIRRVQANDDPGVSRDQLQYENPDLGQPGLLPEKLAAYFHDVNLFAAKYRREFSDLIGDVVQLLGHQTRFSVPTDSERQEYPVADLVEFPMLFGTNLMGRDPQDPDALKVLMVQELLRSKLLLDRVSEHMAEMERKKKEQETKFLNAQERLQRLQSEEKELEQMERTQAQDRRLQSIRETISEIEVQLPLYNKRKKDCQTKQAALETVQVQLEKALQSGDQEQLRQENAKVAREIRLPEGETEILLEFATIRNFIQLAVQPPPQEKQTEPVSVTGPSGRKKLGVLAATLALSAAAGYYGFSRPKVTQPDTAPRSVVSRTTPQIADVPTSPWVRQPEYQESFLTHFVSVALQENRNHALIMRAPGAPDSSTHFTEEDIVAAAKRGGKYQMHTNGDVTLITDVALVTLRKPAVETMLALWKFPESNLHFLHFYLNTVLDKKVAATITPKNSDPQNKPSTIAEILSDNHASDGYKLEVDHKNGGMIFENDRVRISVAAGEFEKMYTLYHLELSQNPEILSQERVNPSPLHTLRKNSDLDFREFVVRQAVDAYAHPERKIVHPTFNYQKGSTLERMQEMFVLEFNPRELETFLLGVEISQTSYTAYPSGVYQISLGDRGAILFEPGDAAILMNLYKEHIAQLKKRGKFLLPLSPAAQLSEAIAYSHQASPATPVKK